MIQDVGNIELCELLETARAGISCTKKQGSVGNSLNFRWTFFQSLSMSSRMEDLMDIDMGKSGETKNTFRPTN